jgi:hypothetical protein
MSAIPKTLRGFDKLFASLIDREVELAKTEPASTAERIIQLRALVAVRDDIRDLFLKAAEVSPIPDAARSLAWNALWFAAEHYADKARHAREWLAAVEAEQGGAR